MTAPSVRGAGDPSAHPLRNVDGRASARARIKDDVAGIGIEPKQVLNNLRWQLAEIGIGPCVICRSLEGPNIKVLPGFGGLSEFRRVALFRHHSLIVLSGTDNSTEI